MHIQSRKGYVHLWCPSMFGFGGGIQVFSRHLLRALQSLYPELYFEVILKNDTVIEGDANLSNNTNTRFYLTGRWPALVRTLFYAVRLLQLGFRRSPRFVIATHLHFAPAAKWLKYLAGIPYCVVAHGIEAWDLTRPGLHNGLSNADRVCAVSSYTRKRVVNMHGLSDEKVVILPNTVDADNFWIGDKPQYLLKRYGLSCRQQVILTVARLESSERYKGYDAVLQALPSIRRALPAVHYIIAGKGDDKGRIEELVRELEVQDCVTLAGYIRKSELCDHYNLCDVFAMPSKGEGFGIVFLEALACGKPVLAGNKDGSRDALNDGELGILVDPDNVSAIAREIILVLRREHSHPNIFRPEVLRELVAERFGFDAFKRTVAERLDTFLKGDHAKTTEQRQTIVTNG